MTAKYIRNCWYMAGWSSEIGDEPLRRILFEQPVVLYRLQDGQVAALIDRCPHRFAPLSAGTREGDTLVCPYHGLAFSAEGTCVRNPFSPTIPKGAHVRRFAVLERDGIVWLWAGDATAADPAKIPDFSALWIEGQGGPIEGYLPLRADYQFGTDNLMDLSHIEFVHRGSFAGAGVIFAGQHQVIEEGERLHSNWWMPNVPAPSHTFGIYDRAMQCDHWLEMRWDPPASMYLQIGSCPTGGSRMDGVIAHQLHILTPAEAGKAHYFWATSRNAPPNPGSDEFLRSMMQAAFIDEDKPIIEAACDNLGGADFWDLQPVYLGIDAGGTRARRMIQSIINSESSQTCPA
ncbi:MAG: Toluene-4-sulfonate monooxygenase system iron-sulfur subunit TsaM1 [Pseudomonadota bacterium]|jgi:vanillate O-demethylase monooxygenase subunit